MSVTKTSANRQRTLVFIGLLALSAVLLIFTVRMFSDIVFYFLLAFALTGILRTPTHYLSQTQLGGAKLPRGIAILLSFGILVGIIVLFVLIFKPLIVEQIKVVAEIDYHSLTERVAAPVKFVERFLTDNQIIEAESGFLVNSLKTRIVDLEQLGDILDGILITTGNFFFGSVAVIFISFFLLYEKGILRRSLIAVIPNQYFEVTIGVLYKIEKLLSNYLFGLFLQMISIFTVVSFGLTVGGIKYAITIGVFAAVANLVPFLGPLVGTVFGLIIGLSTLAAGSTETVYLMTAGKIFTVFVFAQLSDNLMLQPIIFSKSVKAHPLEIFLIIFVGAGIAGAAGMIAAIPFYTILRVSFVELSRGYKRYRIFRNPDIYLPDPAAKTH